MRCPKCRMEQEDANLLCDYCGVVFARWQPEGAGSVSAPRSAGARIAELTAAERAERTLVIHEPPMRRALAFLRERVTAAPPLAGTPALAGRALLLAFLTVWGVRLIATSIESAGVGRSFLHLVNLPFHEAGHVFCTPCGAFVRTLGGSLGQLAMPMICALTLLLRTRDPFGAGVALWWFGENLLDLAPYIADAGTGELPLLGGNTGETSPYGFHDWEYLLTETGRLGQAHDLARASHTLGAAIMVLALAWMATCLLRGWRAGRVAAAETPLRRAA